VLAKLKLKMDFGEGVKTGMLRHQIHIGQPTGGTGHHLLMLNALRAEGVI